MRRKPLILAGLAVVFLGIVLLIPTNAQENPCFPLSMTVPGGQSRAALETSDVPGLWRFTIERVKGSISKVEIQIYENALPTAGSPESADAPVYMVCASNPDPFGRLQATCGAGVPVGHNMQAGAVLIKRVKDGIEGSITLDEGMYCLRPVAFGKGEVTISVQPPPY